MKCSLLALAALLGVSGVSGCSDFVFNASGSSVVSGRTMDFEVDLRTVVEVIPRGSRFQEPPVRGCPRCADFEWTSRLGFVAFNMYGMNAAADGLNERGLSAAWLYLVATEYPSFNGSEGLDPALPVVTGIPSYILGNFGSVKEAREGLAKVQLAGFDDAFNEKVLKLKTSGSAPLHVSVHDRNGESLVIEFLGGKAVFYDNVNQVLTNDPPLEQQLAKLHDHGLFLDSYLLNVPGGYGPVARFQRLSVLNHHAGRGYENSEGASYVVATEEQRAVADTLHLLSTVVRPPPGEATEWTVVRDHKRLMLYIQSTQNQLLRRIDLNMLDFGQLSSRRFIPVTYGNWFFDVTLPLMDDGNKAKTFDLPPRSKVQALIDQHSGNEQTVGEVMADRALENYSMQQRQRRRSADKAIRDYVDDEVSAYLDEQPLARPKLLMQDQRSQLPAFLSGTVFGAILAALMMTLNTRFNRRRGYQTI